MCQYKIRDKGQGRKISEIKSDHLITEFRSFCLPRLSPSSFFLLLFPHPLCLGTSASASPLCGSEALRRLNGEQWWWSWRHRKGPSCCCLLPVLDLLFPPKVIALPGVGTPGWTWLQEFVSVLSVSHISLLTSSCLGVKSVLSFLEKVPPPLCWLQR